MRIGDTEVKIEEIDTASYPKTQKRLDSLTKPVGSLGRLEDLAKQFGVETDQTLPELARSVGLLRGRRAGVKRGPRCTR